MCDVMKILAIIGGWIKTHVITTIIIGVVVVGGAVATSVILLNDKDVSNQNVETKEDNKQVQDQELEESQEPELNEDGCPVGMFLNYYGICQDEHLYEPQECPDGYIWNPNMDITKDNGDGTASVDYEATYGIDGLPKGACSMNFDTMNAWYKSQGLPGLDSKDRDIYDHLNDCGRGGVWNSETKTCIDRIAQERARYEKYVLSKHDPKDDLPKCSERSETDQACLKD